MLSLSSDDVVREREALEELVKSDGWRYFVKRALDNWKGSGYFARQSAALVKGHVEAIVVHNTALEIERALNWPKDRILELKGVVDE